MYYELVSNNKELEISLKKYDQDIINILNFFQVKNIKINLKVLSYIDFKHEFNNYLGYEINEDITGFIEDDTNTIILLSYEDFKYTNHKGDTFNDYLKIVIHELVHIIHSVACNHDYPNDELWEGIAVYLSKQYDFENKDGYGNYYNYGLYIYNYLKEHSKQELLKLLNVK